MLSIDNFRLSTRMFRVSRSRTILTILGISVGIGAILFLVSLGYGLQRLILSQITTSDTLLSLDVDTGNLESLKIGQEEISRIKSIDGVEKVSPLVLVPAQMNAVEISSDLMVNFADSDYFKLEGTVLKKGRFYTDDEEDKRSIVISSGALKLFNLNEDNCFDKDIKFTLFTAERETGGEVTEAASDSIKDIINLEGNYRIVGVTEDESFGHVFIPISVSQDLNILDYSRLKVKVVSEEYLAPVREEIVSQGFIVSALSDIIDQANQIFRIIQVVLALFGVIALIVSAIGMFNTMTITLLERTQEIGIMKALGATSLDIWNMFLGESVVIGFIGGIGGIVIGMLGGQIFNLGINFLAQVLGGIKIDLFYTPFWFIVMIIIFSSFVGLATGIYPANRAAKINPLEALRYK